MQSGGQSMGQCLPRCAALQVSPCIVSLCAPGRPWQLAQPLTYVWRWVLPRPAQGFVQDAAGQCRPERLCLGCEAPPRATLQRL
jgi:hypothetical protein